jgi:3'(2'), 5'-bisphosphate nucleotidase
MINLDNPEVQFAMSTVRTAALLTQYIRQQADVLAISKEDYSPVTVADFAAQAVVGASLEEAFPNDILVAEEDTRSFDAQDQMEVLDLVTRYSQRALPDADRDQIKAWIDRGAMAPTNRFWTLDPIDGTKGFLRGDQYATAFALIEDGEVRLAVIGCPNLADAKNVHAGSSGTLVVAARGQGAWATSLEQPESYEPLHVSGRKDTSQARMLRSFESAHTNTGQIGDLVHQLSISAEPVPMDSQAKYCVLAAGRGDLLVRLLSSKKPHYQEKIWDQAAGVIVVEEAGGKITDLHGRKLDFSVGRTLAKNRGVLASNGHLHAPALAALEVIGA